MNHNIPNILALNIGARQIGAAVFENQKLIFYAIKSIKKPTKPETLNQVHKVLEKLIFDYGIQIIALGKLAHPQQKNSFAKAVYEKTKDFANEKNIKIFELEPLFVRQMICRNKIVTKQHTFEIITRLYPELSNAFLTKRIWLKMYYAYLFNAIAVGLVCTKEVRENTNLKITRKNSGNEQIRENN